MTTKLSKRYTDDLQIIIQKLSDRLGCKTIKLVAPLYENLVGFVCKLQIRTTNNETIYKAIKVLYTPTHELKSPFDELIKNSSCPNLVKIDEITRLNRPNGPTGYILMECCKESLDLAILGEVEVWNMLRDVLHGLKVLHDKGFVHRDIKPANVLLRGSVYVLADFGVTRLAADQMTPGVGTVYYRAPEASTDQYSSASDIYSLGLTALTLMKGSLVFPLSTKNVETAISQLDKCSDLLKSLLRRMLNVNPSERPTVDTLLTEVQNSSCELASSTEIQQILEGCKKFREIASQICKKCEQTRKLHSEIVQGLKSQIEVVEENILQYVNWSKRYNNGDREASELICSLVDEIIEDTQVIRVGLEDYVTLVKKPTDRLQAIKKDLEARIESDEKMALTTGAGTGIAVGSGITATLVAIPTATFGAAGAFIVAGVAFPPILIILGGATLLASIGVGLAAAIKSALNTGDKKLLQTVTQLIQAICNIGGILERLQVIMLNIEKQLKLRSSKPNNKGQIRPDTIKKVENYGHDINATFQELQQTEVPRMPAPLLQALKFV